ncbi:CaiB/BaiF CoA transferase family protein [Chelatococcus asaccharovorans]|uniref:Crotonobetainyl-CoA:carnitine CoA-transferase CaiB-like acyl-CoA transferase n=1 Tax=Chelatococcus asaccharovorans TaxID=28210 RepID=A0A2V3U544_9HYPH|nr:CoA transferase [Chelatococcus asaccharovorans]MBS7703082.1 CoA transferase [Chelatococcus asaccharovorans]PXW57382.1 crotonobetainyl-CoA:carnitine CoA-transferase CaiB-like acyl-CoA transferase [Chelatococcus asaccharovorans]
MQPLEGFRVLDLTHVLAGPCATHHLRCLGAEVIKVERPGSGDPMRALALQPELGGLPPGFRTLNAGKKSVVIDLATAEGRAAILRLAESADIFVENFRPGVAKRLGLGADDMRSVRPDVIYCSISGWGQSGAYSARGAYDHVIQAATGMMALQGNSSDRAPVKVGFPVVDIATGMAAAEAILAAVIRRLRGDKGPITIDVSMVDSALSLMSGPASATLATGRAPEKVGNRGFVGSPGAETFATSDGHLSVAANTKGQFATLCRLLGRPELAEPPYLPGNLAGEAFLANLATDELREALGAAFAQARASELEVALNAAGVPAARVRDLGEYLAELYPATPGIGLVGEPVALAPPFRWEQDAPLDVPPAPRLGADTAMVVD